MCLDQYTQVHIININKTCAFLQTTGGNDEPNIVIMRKSLRTSQHVQLRI